jgi:hypothetical protein
MMTESQLNTPTQQPPTPRRPRGAPKGNLNALKYGFYTSRLEHSELVGLPDHNFKGLDEEITLLRVLFRSLVDRIPEAASLPEYISAIRAFCHISLALNRMIKTQHFLSQGTDELSLGIDEAIKRLTGEWHLNDPDPYSYAGGQSDRPPHPSQGTPA